MEGRFTTERGRLRASQRRRIQSAGVGLVVAVIAEFAPCSGVAESVKATCDCEADFDWNKAPKTLFVSEPLLSAQGIDGICGS